MDYGHIIRQTSPSGRVSRQSPGRSRGQRLGCRSWGRPRSSEVRPGSGHGEPALQLNEVKHLHSLWMFLVQQFQLIVAAKHGKPPKMDGFNANVESYRLSFCVFVHILDFYFLWAPLFF